MITIPKPYHETKTLNRTLTKKRPIQVCFVIDNLSRAGTELQLLTLIKHLDRQEIEPHLFLLDGQGETSKALQPEGFPVHPLGVNRLCSYRAAQAARRFRSYLKEHKIDLVQTFFVDSTRFAAPIARSVGCKIFGSRRNIGHMMTATDRQIARIYNRCFIDKIIANAEAVRQAVIQQEKADPSNVIVIHNGIELEPFRSIVPWENQPEEAMRTIGMVANLREIKGVDIFIRAAEKIRSRHPNTLFQIAGVGDTAFYQAWINKLNLTSHIHLLGSIKTIPRFLDTLDIAILPSRAEGLSNALLEYMAAGRPIVATEVGGNPELIQHEQTGMLVPSENVDAMANAITRLLEKSTLAEKIAIKAKEAITHKFSAKVIAVQYQKVYAEHLLA